MNRIFRSIREICFTVNLVFMWLGLSRFIPPCLREITYIGRLPNSVRATCTLLQLSRAMFFVVVFFFF